MGWSPSLGPEVVGGALVCSVWGLLQRACPSGTEVVSHWGRGSGWEELGPEQTHQPDLWRGHSPTLGNRRPPSHAPRRRPQKRANSNFVPNDLMCWLLPLTPGLRVQPGTPFLPRVGCRLSLPTPRTCPGGGQGPGRVFWGLQPSVPLSQGALRTGAPRVWSVPA